MAKALHATQAVVDSGGSPHARRAKNEDRDCSQGKIAVVNLVFKIQKAVGARTGYSLRLNTAKINHIECLRSTTEHCDLLLAYSPINTSTIR
jgi:hypothetical protein